MVNMTGTCTTWYVIISRLPIKLAVRFYGNVYGKLCFGYEECGQYSEAEKAGSVALEHTPNDIWAIHSMAHVYEETLRPKTGTAFLDKTADNWRPRANLVTHVWWHNALFHLQMGDFEAALSLFDDVIMGRVTKGTLSCCVDMCEHDILK